MVSKSKEVLMKEVAALQQRLTELSANGTSETIRFQASLL